jgi:dTDP-4-dehydrorhamnose 3,5-epimerase
MTFEETAVPGAFVVTPERAEDDRGFFARTWCRREFAGRGLNPDLSQCGVSWNRRRGTLRGLHYQADPHPEAKLVRCTRGAVFDVAVDLRPGSATFGRWAAAELTADNGRMLYIPEGCAHGFQTLDDDSEVFYQISAAYHPDLARGVRWDDPALNVAWPLPVGKISERDARLPTLAELDAR